MTYSYTQQMFVEWLAQKTGQSVEAVSRRYEASMAVLAGGHAGTAYRAFCDTSYQLFSIFTDDSPQELETSYRFHGHLHFLRMLTYFEPHQAYVARALPYHDGGQAVTILDYGCGLAQWSRALARHLHASGRECVLYLADLPTCRWEFLEWEASQQGYQTILLTCETHRVHPNLPSADVLIATEVLEHVNEPQTYLTAFHRALVSGGVLMASLSAHTPEFMHISPDLRGLADQLRHWDYRELFPACWKKP